MPTNVQKILTDAAYFVLTLYTGHPRNMTAEPERFTSHLRGNLFHTGGKAHASDTRHQLDMLAKGLTTHKPRAKLEFSIFDTEQETADNCEHQDACSKSCIC